MMGWQWLEGDTDVPYLTERESFCEVLLKTRLAAALRKLNLRDGQSWLDDARIARAIRDLEQAAGHRLMEINQSKTELLLKGTVTEGLPDWEQGRPQPVKFIDFENWANNDFLVINQFKVELTSGRGHVIPDAVLFVNGIPLVMAEFKSPGIQNPLHEAINQLLRYSNQRREQFPTLYSENEGVERLFHTNQLLIASNFFEARAATIGAPPEAYLEWVDTSPLPLSTVAEELGAFAPSADEGEAAEELNAVGPEQPERGGTPLFYRKPEQRPAAMRDTGVTLRSQQVLVAGMLRPKHLLDLARNFTVFQQVDGKTRKVVATSREAVMTYLDKLEQARRGLIAELGALPAATLALPDDEVGKLDDNTRFLVRIHPQLAKLSALEIAAVFSRDHNDLESWWEWSDKDKQEIRIAQFKRRLAIERTDKTDPLSILIVNNTLLTGFDAPVEQVLYLDRKIVAHDLMQAIARVNRTCGSKKCGYVVDYIGVAEKVQALINAHVTARGGQPSS